MLKRNSARVEIVYDGYEGIQFLKQAAIKEEELPDVILLDLDMPVWNGWKFLEEFNKIEHLFLKKIRIYMVTSSTKADNISEALRNPCVSDYIFKPLAHKDIIRILNSN